MFAVAPLFLILLLAWVERGAPRPRVVASAAAAAAALLLLAIPFDRFVTTSAVSDTLMLLPWWAIQLTGTSRGSVWLAFLGAVALRRGVRASCRAASRSSCRSSSSSTGSSPRPIWYGPYPYGFKQAGAGALFQGIRGAQRDWIDRAVPPGADVAVLWTGRSDRFTVNQNEFFNRSVGQVYYTGRPTPRRDRRAARRGRPADGVVRPADGARSDPATSSPTARSSRTRSRSPVTRARDDGLEGERPARAREDAHRRALPERHVVGPPRDLDAGALPRRLAHGLALGRRAAASRREHRVDARRASASAWCRTRRRRSASRSRSRGGTCTRGVRRLADRRPERGDPGQHGRPGARRPLQRVRLPAVRIAFDVSPALASADGHRQLHPRLARGHARGSRRRARARRVRADEPERPGRIREALDGLDVELRTWPLPASHAVRTAWSMARPPCRRAAARPLRRAPLHRLDVPAAALRPPRDDDPRPRPAALPRVDANGRSRCTAASTRTQPGPATSSSSTPPSRQTTSTELLGVEPDRIRVAPPGVKHVFTADGDRGRPRRAVRPQRRHARAAQEPPGARRGAPAARRRHPARGRRRRGLGRAAGARRPARRRLGFVSDEELAGALPRRRRRRLPVAVRGLRDADRRGDGVRHAGRRVVPPSMDEACGRRCRPRRPPRSRGDRRRDRAGARRAASALIPRGLEHAARFTWRATGEAMLAGYEEAR